MQLTLSSLASVDLSSSWFSTIGVGVWSCEGPKPTSESVMRVPNLDGDARRVHGGLSWFGQKKALCLARRGGVLYFLAPKCLCRGYKLWEREQIPGLREKK
jgi:hypothetical protein